MEEKTTEKKQRNGSGAAALILGIISMIFCWIPLINILTIILGIIGLTLGLCGIKRVKKALAISGTVLCVISIAVTIIIYSTAAKKVDTALKDENTSYRTQKIHETIENIDRDDYESESEEITETESEKAPDIEPVSEETEAEAVSEKVTESETDEPESESEEITESEPNRENNLGEYRVVPTGLELDRDWEGKDIAVVTYEFTNNSDENASFMISIEAKAFQNGVELANSYLNDVDSDNLLKEIKPGVTIEVKRSYELTDKTPVEIEIKELLSFNDEKITKTFNIK